MRLSPLRMAPIGLLCLGLMALMSASRATSVSEVVKAFCLSAYQADLKKQGRTLSLSQIDRTCGCVGERVAQGSDVEDAHDTCGHPQEQRSVRTATPPSGAGAGSIN